MKFAIILSITVFAAIPAAAEAYVATTGSDANNCTIATPCRTINRALTVNYSVRFLDAGSFIADTIIPSPTGVGTISLDGSPFAPSIYSNNPPMSISAPAGYSVDISNLTILGGSISVSGGGQVYFR